MYSVFVKAWYSGNTYAIFKSNGVIIDTKKPAVQNILGSSVRNIWLISSNINNIKSFTVFLDKKLFCNVENLMITANILSNDVL